MSSQVNLDIEVAVAKDIKNMPAPSKPIEVSHADLRELDRQLEQQKNEILLRREEERLKDPTVRALIIQQQRIKLKEPIFQKYAPLIEKELQIAKMEAIDLNESFRPDFRHYSIQIQFVHGLGGSIIRPVLKEFQYNLWFLRHSTCWLKYALPRCTCLNVVFWVSCFCIMPIMCCCYGCLSESKSHKRLLEIYEKYEGMMVKENRAVALTLDQ